LTEFYWRRPKICEMVDCSGFWAGSSLGDALFGAYRLWPAGLTSGAEFASAGCVAVAEGTAGTCSSALIVRRWPSNTVVVQVRSLAIIAAQILAAAAASLTGPATSRSCMPSPLRFSLITMIGRKSASGAFDLDLSSPRQSARKPGIEFAPPTSTPNSVR